MLEAAVLSVGMQLTCLAVTLYHEARGEGNAGMLGVANVVINRMHDPRWPDTLCEVVSQGPTLKWDVNAPLRNKCQFSFYCDGKSDIPTNQKSFSKAVRIAEDAWYSYNLSVDITEGATFYHATSVSPNWPYSYITTINNHKFYK
jgi:spore germination cell wall hydrolase CwlJ-like protein